MINSKGKETLKSTGEYTIDEMIIVDLYINVCEAMGANIVNTVVEGVAPYLEELTGARVGIKILSNLCTERKSISIF